MLKIENLSFSYNLNSGKKILEDISLEVFPGDLTAILEKTARENPLY